MIQRYHNEPVGLRVTPEPGDYLKLHDRILPDGSEQITVGRGGSWSAMRWILPMQRHAAA